MEEYKCRYSYVLSWALGLVFLLGIKNGKFYFTTRQTANKIHACQ